MGRAVHNVYIFICITDTDHGFLLDDVQLVLLDDTNDSSGVCRYVKFHWKTKQGAHTKHPAAS